MQLVPSCLLAVQLRRNVEVDAARSDHINMCMNTQQLYLANIELKNSTSKHCSKPHRAKRLPRQQTGLRGLWLILPMQAQAESRGPGTRGCRPLPVQLSYSYSLFGLPCTLPPTQWDGSTCSKQNGAAARRKCHRAAAAMQRYFLFRPLGINSLCFCLTCRLLTHPCCYCARYP